MNPNSRDDIWQLVCEYTESEQLRKHMLAVEAAMRYYATMYGADQTMWGNIGLVHDFDYEKYPDEHPFPPVSPRSTRCGRRIRPGRNLFL